MIGLPVLTVLSDEALRSVCDCDDSAWVFSPIVYIFILFSKLFQTLRQNVTGVAYNVLIKVFYIETKTFVAVVSAQCDKGHKQYSQHSAAGDIGQGVIHNVGSPWYRC